MRIRAVLFDYDGVIVDSMRGFWSRLHLCLSVARRRCGMWVPDASPIFEGFTDLIQRLAADGLILGVISVNDCSLVRYRLADAGIGQNIKHLACGISWKEKAIRSFCAQFTLEPGEVLFVGDRPIDISAGRKAGVMTAVFRPHNDRRISFRLNGADYHVASHAELLDFINSHTEGGLRAA